MVLGDVYNLDREFLKTEKWQRNLKRTGRSNLKTPTVQASTEPLKSLEVKAGAHRKWLGRIGVLEEGLSREPSHPFPMDRKPGLRPSPSHEIGSLFSGGRKPEDLQVQIRLRGGVGGCSLYTWQWTPAAGYDRGGAGEWVEGPPLEKMDYPRETLEMLAWGAPNLEKTLMPPFHWENTSSFGQGNGQTTFPRLPCREAGPLTTFQALGASSTSRSRDKLAWGVPWWSGGGWCWWGGLSHSATCTRTGLRGSGAAKEKDQKEQLVQHHPSARKMWTSNLYEPLCLGTSSL